MSVFYKVKIFLDIVNSDKYKFFKEGEKLLIFAIFKKL